MKRRMHGQIRDEVRRYMMERGGGPVRTSDIRAALEERLGPGVAASSVRSSLQNERYFERVGRGEFRLRDGASTSR